MQPIQNLYRRASLHVKLTILVSAVTLAVLFICQRILYNYVADSVNRQAIAETQVTLTQAQTYLESRLRGIVERLFYIRLDPGFDDALSDYLFEDTPATQGVAMTALSPCLSLHKITEPLISSVFLYTPKGSFTDMGVSTEQSFQFEESPLWNLAMESDGVVAWGQAQRDEIFITHRRVIPVMHRFAVDGYGGDCVLLANIDEERLTRFLRDILPDDSSDLLLTDSAGNPVTYPSIEAIRALAQQKIAAPDDGLAEWEYEGQRYLTAWCSVESTPFRLFYMRSQTETHRQLQLLMGAFLLANVCALLVLMWAVSRIARGVTKPLYLLANHMQQVEQQGELQTFEQPCGGEAGDLARSFNRMLSRIQGLLEERDVYIARLEDEKERVRIEQQLKRRAELRALQAQINPHFLYNTLDSIRWKAESAGAEDISQMTTALATLFRIGLSRGRELILLEQELQHVESYLQIQKLRYGDRLNYTIDLAQDPALLKLYTVKLILQPLVENAIYHGVKESEREGMITITGRKTENRVELCVTDNGSGIPPERLKMLQADLARGLSVSGEGYGIFNVNERIRLYFGAEYGLRLESTYGCGTRAVLSLPCITQEEAERYVSLTNRR